jgi:hypothetical protein
VVASSDRPDIVNTLVNDDGTLSLFYGGHHRHRPGHRHRHQPDRRVDRQPDVHRRQRRVAVQIGSGGVGNAINFTEADGGTGSISISRGSSAIVRFTGTGLAIAPGKKPGLAGTVSARRRH